ncbi:PREDICTED: pyridoxine/pyridoxamine 5'-phosphate oxidase [Cyphomyrmex costatus]|uniref:pyridoxine/pyridoxamine 5'-phosphate oxidase n=1 Tax=Cyphomyrmex costatus TaxID=456900 RepID=UPI0008523396|nr:PREDICTED: pyridoxine/pyridoxamine 5'-phosphate oxidase [Cyphomyrmex costatus]
MKICRNIFRRLQRFVELIHTYFTKEMAMTDNVVGLARIDPLDNPVDLFRIWRDEAIKFQFGLVNACCLATVSPNSKVSSRNLILREFDDDGFVIMTDARSQKVKDMNCNSYAAMCFLWDYQNDKQHHITRQVRIEGWMKKLERPACQLIYEREPLYCKIRAHLCHQDQPADWDDLNHRYNEILAHVQYKGDDLTMPDHVVSYKLSSEMMEFYYARDQLIGDRIHYKKNEINKNYWEYQRIAA